MCECSRKGTSAEEFDIIGWPVVGQLLLFLFRHGDVDMFSSARWRSLAVEVGAQAKNAAPELPRLLESGGNKRWWRGCTQALLIGGLD